jgi:hypothetical protein
MSLEDEHGEPLMHGDLPVSYCMNFKVHPGPHEHEEAMGGTDMKMLFSCPGRTKSEPTPWPS